MMLKLFDLSLKLNGFPLEKAKEEYAKILAIPEEKYADYVEQKKQEIVNYHFENNSFYRNLVGDKLPQRWEDLPVLTKKDLQRPLEERLSHSYSLKSVFINKTSGSSGNPFTFARDKYAHALTWASIIHRFGVHGIDFNTSLQARFYGMSKDFKGYYLTRLKDFLSNRYRFSILDFSDEGLEKILDEFKKRNFNYINGYTTCIMQVAKFLHRKELTLKQVCPTLMACVTTSEMLLAEDKEYLIKHLGIPVINEYGSAELGVIALENSSYEWRLNNEELFVEILDDNNNPVPDGMLGNIVITSLFNLAHPFIRYKVGDIGAIKSISAKKKILLELKGRESDFAVLPSGKKAAGMTFYVITKDIMDKDGNIKEFKIIQTDLNKFRIEYSSSIEISDKKRDSIIAKFDEYLEKGLVYEFVRKDNLERTLGGKLKQFESRISN